MGNANIFLEKRDKPRISIKIPVQYRLEDNETQIENLTEWRKNEKHSETMDLSLGGMSLTLDQPFPKGSIPRFDIFLPSRLKQLTIYAEVVWASETGAGLRFLMINNEDLEVLRVFLDKVSTETSSRPL